MPPAEGGPGRRAAPRLLLVVAAFPETGGARVDKLVKYLPRVGVEPLVLSAAECDTPPARDLRAAYPAALETHLARSFGPAPFTARYLVRGAGARHYRILRALSFPERFVMLPDYMVRWIPAALRIAHRLARAGRIDAVLTSSPPESTHLVGLSLRRRLGVPWIADFRDLWTEKGLLCRPATRVHAALIRRLERTVFTTADHVIANTPENAERHAARFALSPERLTVIPNGFDREDLAAAAAPAAADGVFRIGYMGHFDKHGFPWRAFLAALRALVDEAGAERVRVVHCGHLSPEVGDTIRALGLDGVVERHGHLSHGAALARIAAADLLLNLLYENAYSDAIVNFKLYPYLMLGRPILSIGPERGAVARLLDETRAGVSVSAGRGDAALAAALRRCWMRWRCGAAEGGGDPAVVAAYDFHRHAERLAAVVRRLRGDRGAAGDDRAPMAARVEAHG